MARRLRPLALAVAAGRAIGLAAQHLSGVHGGLRWGEALGAPWLVVAVAAGARAAGAHACRSCSCGG